MTATVIHANGEYHGITPKNGTDFSLEEAQKIVGGYVEVIHLSSTQIMIVNEEGLIRNLPYNNDQSMKSHNVAYKVSFVEQFHCLLYLL